jgi:hypothetical protein
MGEYIPVAPISDEARRRNGSLPGMGGVFNLVNLHVYHYAGNNPVKYIDPDGNKIFPITKATQDKIDRLGTGRRYIFEKSRNIDNGHRWSYVGDRPNRYNGPYMETPDVAYENIVKRYADLEENITVHVQEREYEYHDSKTHAKPGQSTKGTEYILKDDDGNTLMEFHDVNNDGYIDYTYEPPKPNQTEVPPRNTNEQQ